MNGGTLYDRYVKVLEASGVSGCVLYEGAGLCVGIALKFSTAFHKSVMRDVDRKKKSKPRRMPTQAERVQVRRLAMKAA